MNLPRLPAELLEVPSTQQRCAEILAALGAALPVPVMVPLRGGVVPLVPTPEPGYLQACCELAAGLEISVLVTPFGNVSVQTARRAPGVPLTAEERHGLGEQLQHAWLTSVPERTRAALVVLWALNRRRLHLLNGRDEAADAAFVRGLLCRLAAAQEPEPLSSTARRLLAGGWHGTAAEMLSIARSICA